MNNLQAKFILQAYRPNGRDAGDATFCEALQQAQTDPALGGWFAREQAFDAAVSARLAAIAPPSGLREAILAGARVSRSAPPAWWRRPALLAMAASLALLLAVAGVFSGREARALPGRLDAIARFALADPVSAHEGPHADKLGQFGAWLETSSNQLGGDMPLDFAGLKAQGCRTINVAGYEVFEICFNRDGKWFHVYAARRGGLAAPWIRQAPVYNEAGDRSSVAWADKSHLYVVVSSAGKEALERLL